jgi:hypothetical protein
MSTITPNKTANASLLAWQDIATANVVVGSAQDVSAKYSGSFSIKIARKTGTAFTSGWPNIRIEASHKTSGNDGWIPLLSVQPALGSSIVNTTLNGAVSAAATTITVTSATNIAAGDILFLEDTATANYELVRVKSVSGTTITLEEAVTYAHASGKIVTDQAEMYFPSVDLGPYARVRAVADNANSGQTIAVEVTMTTQDSQTVT